MRGAPSHQKEVEGPTLPSYQSVKRRREEEANSQTSVITSPPCKILREEMMYQSGSCQEMETKPVICTGKF